MIVVVARSVVEYKIWTIFWGEQYCRVPWHWDHCLAIVETHIYILSIILIIFEKMAPWLWLSLARECSESTKAVLNTTKLHIRKTSGQFPPDHSVTIFSFFIKNQQHWLHQAHLFRGPRQSEWWAVKLVKKTRRPDDLMCPHRSNPHHFSAFHRASKSRKVGLWESPVKTGRRASLERC